MGIDLAKYFARIGYDGPHDASLATLSTIVERHADSIPFESSIRSRARFGIERSRFIAGAVGASNASSRTSRRSARC